LADAGYVVRLQVAVIVTLESTLAALAAKEATHTIPIIFMQGADMSPEVARLRHGGRG
jgi:hypothetical protein